MTNLVTLLGRKFNSGNAKPAAAAQPVSPPPPVTVPPPVMPQAPAEIAPPETDLELDDDLFFPLAARLGQENEAVRNLLLDAEHKIGELETIKLSIARLVDPVCNTLRGYEETKNEKLLLQRALTATREATNKLRDDLAAAEKKAGGFKAECGRLQEMVNVAKQNIAALERNKAEQNAEIGVQRAHVAELQEVVQQQASDLRLSREENRRLAERIAAGDQRTVLLEGELQAAQQSARQASQERASIQASLDKSHAEQAQMARRLSDADKALASSQVRLAAMEANLAEVQNDRSRLSTALDDAKHQHADTMNQLNSRFEAVQARSRLTESMLEEARQALMARAEEMRTFERHLGEGLTANDMLAERLSGVEAVLKQRETQIKDLEKSRMALTEQTHKLIEVATEREAMFDDAQRKAREQSDLVEMLQQELQAARNSSEIQIEEITARLQREHLDRSMAEGALETARKDVARLLYEIAALRVRAPAADSHEAQVRKDPFQEAA